MNTHQLWQMIKTEANNLGFTHIGAAPATPVPHVDEYRQWVDAGRHAGMAYLAREDAMAKRANPELILEGCQRVICLALPYQPPQHEPGESKPGKGRISSYARTHDYHDIIWEKLSQLESFINSLTGPNTQLKSYVDKGPILERSYAALSGIGVVGKNSCLIIPKAGSYFFLAEILTNLELPVESPFTSDLCKNCTKCIDACPTSCILPNRTIDAGRCISYLTIENKGFIPDDLKEQMGPWIFGCDICQMVCPHNSWKPDHANVLGEPLLPEWIDLIELLTLDDAIFRQKYIMTPLARAKHDGLRRNAAIVLGNQQCREALPAIEQTLSQEDNPAVQDACRWAIKKIKSGS